MGYMFLPTKGPSSGYHNIEFENIGLTVLNRTVHFITHNGKDNLKLKTNH
jgi:hypothetical protein